MIEDAGEAVSVVVFGDFDVDQTSAGDPELEVKPEEIAAEEFKPDTLQSTTETDEVQPQRCSPSRHNQLRPNLWKLCRLRRR